MATPNPPPVTNPSTFNVRKATTSTEEIDIFVEVLRDGTTGDSTVKGKTSYESEGAISDGALGTVFSQTPAASWQQKGKVKKITQVDGPAQIKGTVKIKTVYGPRSSAKDLSAYGRGTTPDDEKAGDVTLGFQESCHRNDYIEYLKTKPLPKFTGKVGMSPTQYDQAAAAFGAAVAKFLKDMKSYSDKRTDEVGYKRSTYKSKGPRKP
jgi:hypothetical protein